MTAIDNKWTSLGGAASPVGNTVPGQVETPTPDRKGTFRHYQRGSIYHKHFTFFVLQVDVCPHAIYGSIRDFWAGLGWEMSPLGWPITDELPARTTDLTLYRFSDFENGVLYWRYRSRDPISGQDRPAEVINLNPLSPGLIQSATGGRLNPTAAGLAATVRAIIEARIGDRVVVQNVQINAFPEYSCTDGVVHNRLHIIQVRVQSRTGCVLNPIVDLTLAVEIVFDRVARTVSGILRSWSANISNLIFDIGKGDIQNALNSNLNPMVGTAVVNETLPSSVNVLSVKTMLNGDINVYIEPVCLITTAAARAQGKAEDDPILDSVRQFRDRYLVDLPGGRQVTDYYYWFSPQIVEAINRSPNAETIYRTLYDHYILPAVEQVQAGKLDGVFNRYSDQIPGWLTLIARLPDAYPVMDDLVKALLPPMIELLSQGKVDEFNRQALQIVADRLQKVIR